MKQEGASFLEIVMVIAIMMIVSSFVAPNILDWRRQRILESDYLSLLSTIDYIKTRARIINGTSTLSCAGANKITYKISNNPQSSANSLASGFSSSIVEDPTGENHSFNVLSGDTTVVGAICNNLQGIFSTTGFAGLEGSGSAITIELNRNGSRSTYGAYQIVINQTTGFVQKYKWSLSRGTWVEQD